MLSRYFLICQGQGKSLLVVFDLIFIKDNNDNNNYSNVEDNVGVALVGTELVTLEHDGIITLIITRWRSTPSTSNLAIGLAVTRTVTSTCHLTTHICHIQHTAWCHFPTKQGVDNSKFLFGLLLFPDFLLSHNSMLFCLMLDPLIICPIAIAYSTGQIIKSVCVCQSVSVCKHSHGRIS